MQLINAQVVMIKIVISRSDWGWW